jgi:hypothetical protein
MVSGLYESASREIQPPSVKGQKAVKQNKQPIGQLETLLASLFLVGFDVVWFGRSYSDRFAV